MSGSMGPFFPACPWAPLQCVRSEGKQMFLTHKCPTYDKLQLSLQTVQQIAMCFTLLPPSLSLSLSLSPSLSLHPPSSLIIPFLQMTQLLIFWVVSWKDGPSVRDISLQALNSSALAHNFRAQQVQSNLDTSCPLGRVLPCNYFIKPIKGE